MLSVKLKNISAYFSMLESKLWHNKTEIKGWNVKAAKMVKFIKTCDHHPHKFNFGHFLSSIVHLLSAGGTLIVRKCCSGEMGNFLLPGGEFCLGDMQKWKDSIFWHTNVSSSNLNSINLKLFQGLRQDARSAGAKKVLDALENDTKANFQENIPGKVQFQKKWGAMAPLLPLPPLRQGACFLQP